MGKFPRHSGGARNAPVMILHRLRTKGGANVAAGGVAAAPVGDARAGLEAGIGIAGVRGAATTVTVAETVTEGETGSAGTVGGAGVAITEDPSVGAAGHARRRKKNEIEEEAKETGSVRLRKLPKS